MLLAGSTTSKSFTAGNILSFILPLVSFVNQSNGRSNLHPATRTVGKKLSQVYVYKSTGITSMTTAIKTTTSTTATTSVTGETGSNCETVMMTSESVSVTTAHSGDVNHSTKLSDGHRGKTRTFLVASFLMMMTQIRETEATFGFLSNGLSQLMGGGGGGGGQVNGRLTGGPISPVGGAAGGRFGVSAGSLGAGGGQSANLIGGLPGLPPGMTMTQDGCLCPVPKAKTKYIAVEVPKIVFVPPKDQQKTKIITIKEVVSEPPANKYSAMSNNYNLDSDSESSYSSDDDNDSGVTDISGSTVMRNAVYGKSSSGGRQGKSKTQATRNRVVKVTKPDDHGDSMYSANNSDDGVYTDDGDDETDEGRHQRSNVAKKGRRVSSVSSGHISNIIPSVRSSAVKSGNTDDDDITVTRDRDIATVMKGSTASIEGLVSSIKKTVEIDDTNDSDNEYRASLSSVNGDRRKRKRKKKKPSNSKYEREEDEGAEEDADEANEESESILKVKKKTKRHSSEGVVLNSKRRKLKSINDVIDDSNNVTMSIIDKSRRQVSRERMSDGDAKKSTNNAISHSKRRKSSESPKYNHLSRYSNSQSKFGPPVSLEEEEREGEDEAEDKEESDVKVESDDATSRMQRLNVRSSAAPFTL